MSTTVTLDELITLKDSLTREIKELEQEKALLIERSKLVSQQIKQLQQEGKTQIVVPEVVKPPKQTVTTECEHCHKNFERNGSEDPSKTRGPPIVFCPSCRKERNKDILELILLDVCPFTGRKTAITRTYYSAQDAESFMCALTADIRLDLHKTLDTIPVTEQIHPTLKTCCVSYVGRLTTTRISAREDIKARVLTGQIAFGALVFNRGSHKDPESANNYTVDGSKAWFNRKIKPYTPNVEPLFVDDSDDHVLSVRTLGNVNSVQIRNEDSLLELIRQHTDKYATPLLSQETGRPRNQRIVKIE